MDAIAPEVRSKFRNYDKFVRARLIAIRSLVYEVAEMQEAGPLTETLKWGQPSYLTEKTKSGSTIRIDATKVPGQVAIYFICHTHLVETFRSQFPHALQYDGNRAILIDADEELNEPVLAKCIGMALTYKRDRR